MGSGCKSTKRLNCKALLPRFAAQQAHAADAAARQQDRWHFRISFCAYTCTILQGGAADGQGVGWRPSAPMRQEVTINMGVPYLNLSAISNDSSRIISEIFSGMPYKNAPYSVFFQQRMSSHSVSRLAIRLNCIDLMVASLSAVFKV